MLALSEVFRGIKLLNATFPAIRSDTPPQDDLTHILPLEMVPPPRKKYAPRSREYRPCDERRELSQALGRVASIARPHDDLVEAEKVNRALGFSLPMDRCPVRTFPSIVTLEALTRARDLIAEKGEMPKDKGLLQTFERGIQVFNAVRDSFREISAPDNPSLSDAAADRVRDGKPSAISR